MRRSILRTVGILMLAVSLGLSVEQLNVSADAANACPTDPFGLSNCMCDYLYHIDVQEGSYIVRYCTYGCNCSDSGGGGHHFYIERDHTVIID